MFRLLFTFTLTTIMIATAGFGALPENPLTDTFRTVLGGILPPDLLNPLDSYLEMVSSPQIQPKLASVSDGAPPSDIAPTEQPPLDPVGWLFSLLERNNNAALPAASSLDATQIALAATQTQVVFLQSVTSTYTQISTGTAIPSIAPPPTAISSATATQIFVPIYFPPSATSLPPLPTFTFTPTFTPSPTFTNTPGVAEGSCDDSSLDSATYDCLVSNIMLNGVVQSSLTVSPNQTFTFSYNYQIWNDPAAPLAPMQLIAGLETVSATTCDYQNIPGPYPGQSGGSVVHTFTAPATPGSYAIFIRWKQDGGCNLANYGGFGVVLAIITVV
jgi:hypothetical protein